MAGAREVNYYVHRTVLGLLGVLGIAGGAGMLWYSFRIGEALSVARAAMQWPVTSGTIVEAHAEWARFKTGQRPFKVAGTYSYQVEGREYSGDEFSPMFDHASMHVDVEATVASLQAVAMAGEL
ncbi:MAG: hypothetical protein ACOYN0_02560 [Phycisphaerales bacterium]